MIKQIHVHQILTVQIDITRPMFADFYHSFYYSLLISGTLIALIFLKRVDVSFRWIAVLIVLTLISELTAKYISFSLRKNNNIIYHFFTVIEYFFYAIIYKQFFSTKKWNTILNLTVWILVAAEIINVIFFQPFKITNTNTMILECLFLIFISLALFNKIRETTEYGNILQEGIFWFNSAVLFYYSFNILIWGFHSIQVYQLKNPPYIIYNANLLLSGLLYLFYSISILLNFFNKRKPKNLS